MIENLIEHSTRPEKFQKGRNKVREIIPMKSQKTFSCTSEIFLGFRWKTCIESLFCIQTYYQKLGYFSVSAVHKIDSCLLCGRKKTHILKRCLARSATCYWCQKDGHYAKMCTSPAKEAPSNTSTCITSALCAIQKAP